jgi:hypothetical protein
MRPMAVPNLFQRGRDKVNHHFNMYDISQVDDRILSIGKVLRRGQWSERIPEHRGNRGLSVDVVDEIVKSTKSEIREYLESLSDKHVDDIPTPERNEMKDSVPSKYCLHPATHSDPIRNVMTQHSLGYKGNGSE